jgi:hypothetical protein
MEWARLGERHELALTHLSGCLRIDVALVTIDLIGQAHDSFMRDVELAASDTGITSSTCELALATMLAVEYGKRAGLSG